MTTYKIVRNYREGHRPMIIKSDLTLAEAQRHCRDKETSSRTATSADAEAHTLKHGPWFDGYDPE